MNRMVHAPGFSLLELVIVLALFGLLCLAGMPSLSHSIQTHQADSGIDTLKKALDFARSQALSQKQTITFCLVEDKKCSQRSSGEMFIFIDHNQNRQVDSSDTVLSYLKLPDDTAQLVLKAAFGRAYIRFKHNGEVMETAGISYCPKNSERFGRVIKVNGSGRSYPLHNHNEIQNSLAC